jgi:hypothetical protein
VGAFNAGIALNGYASANPVPLMDPFGLKVEIASFQIELLEIDNADSIPHAAGPVVLLTPQSDVENFLRLSLVIRFGGCLLDS